MIIREVAVGMLQTKNAQPRGWAFFLSKQNWR
jgi:hypothetical protein